MLTRGVTFQLLVRRLGGATLSVGVAAALAGCGQDAAQDGAQDGAGSAPETAATATTSPAESDAHEHSHRVTQSGVLAEPADARGAFTYDPAAAPVGAKLSVTSEESGGSTTVELVATGLAPDRGYAAHAHTRPCGPTGDAAGPHFQHEQAPEGASNDPAYANPDNEIWFELRTDGNGNASDTATVPFVFSDRAPASVVLHQQPSTATAPGEAGEAGGRLACLTVPFE